MLEHADDIPDSDSQRTPGAPFAEASKVGSFIALELHMMDRTAGLFDAINRGDPVGPELLEALTDLDYLHTSFPDPEPMPRLDSGYLSRAKLSLMVHRSLLARLDQVLG